MAKTLHKGDEVSWKSRNGTSHGEVVKKVESKTQVKGHTVNASSDNPQYIVESNSTGARAAHKPESLKRK